MSEMIPMHIKELKANPWGAYLILADQGGAWHLPIGLRPAMADAVKAQLGGGGDTAVPVLVQSLLNFVKGRLIRVEVVPQGEQRWIEARAVVEHEGAESTFPIRIHDGALLARREGIPLLASVEGLQRSGIRTDETPVTAERAGEDGLKRFVMGCLALGRVDEGMTACGRLLDVVHPRFREVWRAWMGDFYQLKGLPRRAAEEYAAAIAWEIKFGDYFAAVRIAEKMGAIRALTDAPIPLRSPALVEDFSSDHISNVWSGSSDAENLPAPGRPTGRARQFAYDLAEYGYPWLHIAFPDTMIWEGAKKVTWDVHLEPVTGARSLALEFGMDGGDALTGKYLAPPFIVNPGWNAFSVSLREPIWRSGGKTGIRLTAEPLETVNGVQFVLSAEGKTGTGTVAITNIRIE